MATNDTPGPNAAGRLVLAFMAFALIVLFVGSFLYRMQRPSLEVRQERPTKGMPPGMDQAMNGPMKDRVDDMPASPFVRESARIARILPGTRLHWGIFLAIACAVLLYVLLFRTRLGFKIRAVGKNRYAAEALGIGIQKHIVLTLALSGAFGGLAGAVEILGVHYRLFAAFSPGYGFDAIAVALLGMVHPLGIIASAYLFGVLRSGAILMQATYGVNKDMVSVITGIIVLFMGMSAPIGTLIKDRIKRKSHGPAR